MKGLKMAEKKILVLLCGFTLVQLSILGATFAERQYRSFETKVFKFFSCARYSNTCEKPSLEDAYHPASLMVFYVLTASLSILLLVYVVNFEKRTTRKKGDTT